MNLRIRRGSGRPGLGRGMGKIGSDSVGSRLRSKQALCSYDSASKDVGNVVPNAVPVPFHVRNKSPSLFVPHPSA
jgi:hypothetical protein